MTFVLSPRLNSTYACISYVLYIHCYVVHYALFHKSACTIQIGIRHFKFNNSTTTSSQLFNNITVRYPLCNYKYIYYTLPLTHHIHLLTFGTGGFFYLGEGHLFVTLHPTRPGPNLFYVGEEEEPGWGQYSTDHRRRGGPRSLTRHSLERY